MYPAQATQAEYELMCVASNEQCPTPHPPHPSIFEMRVFLAVRINVMFSRDF